jgi:hypothetical protein
MVSLDDLDISTELRAEARAWSVRWERLAEQNQAADGFAAGMLETPAEPVSSESWASLERDGRAVCERLRAELGNDWEVEWAYP